MANIVKIEHPELSGNENTELTDDVAVGATSITVKNIDKFNDKDWILVGNLSNESAEIVQINGAPSDLTITITAIKHAHDEGETVTVTNYDKARVYRATSAAGSYSLVGTVNIDVDEEYTHYLDNDGVASSWYKGTFYNSYTDVETSLSDTSPVRAQVDLIAIPGDTDANSYLSLDMAVEEIDRLSNNDLWSEANMRDRARVLIEATRRINALNIQYSKAIYNQALKFPTVAEDAFSGTADSGSTTSVVDSALTGHDSWYPDYWKYGGITITEGTAEYSTALVSSFDRDTGTLSLDNSLTAAPDTTSQYKLLAPVPKEVRQATAIVALWLLGHNTDTDPNVKSKRIGELSVTYFDKSEKSKLPAEAIDLLRPYIKRVAV